MALSVTNNKHAKKCFHYKTSTKERVLPNIQCKRTKIKYMELIISKHLFRVVQLRPLLQPDLHNSSLNQ